MSAPIAGHDNTRYTGTRHYRSVYSRGLWLGKYMSRLYFVRVSVYSVHALIVDGFVDGSACRSSPRNCHSLASAHERFGDNVYIGRDNALAG